MRTLMSSLVRTMVVAAVVAGWSPRLWAAEPAKDDGPDKAAFGKLLVELRQLHVKLGGAYAEAVAEAKGHDGQASASRKAGILSLQDDIDRKTMRAMMISVRHGWDIPDFSAEQAKAQSAGPATAPAGSVLDAADHAIRAQFAAEAMQIAAKVRLPVIAVAQAAKRS